MGRKRRSMEMHCTRYLCAVLVVVGVAHGMEPGHSVVELGASSESNPDTSQGVTPLSASELKTQAAQKIVADIRKKSAAQISAVNADQRQREVSAAKAVVEKKRANSQRASKKYAASIAAYQKLQVKYDNLKKLKDGGNQDVGALVNSTAKQLKALEA